MESELIPWLASSEERRHSRELDTIWRREDQAAARLGAIGRTAERATLAAACLTKTRNAAELLAPDGAETYALINIAAVSAMVNVINDLGRGR